MIEFLSSKFKCWVLMRDFLFLPHQWIILKPAFLWNAATWIIPFDRVVVWRIFVHAWWVATYEVCVAFLVITFLFWLGSKRDIGWIFEGREWLSPIYAHDFWKIVSARASIRGGIVRTTSYELNICVFAKLCMKIPIPNRFTFPSRIDSS